MPKIKILTHAEKKAFDTPPIFSAAERDNFFALDETLSAMVSQLGHPTNQVGFLLQFGYFKATGRFFTAARFSRDDIEHVKVKLGLANCDIDLTQYKERTLKRHQERICSYSQYKMLDQTEKQQLRHTIYSYVEKCVQPKKIIFSIVQQYRHERIVLPTFHVLCDLVTTAYNDYERSLLSIINHHINADQKQRLDDLMPVNKNENGQPYQRAKLIGIKHLNQSTRTNQIKQSTKNFSVIHCLYQQLIPIIKALNLTPQAVQGIVKSEVRQSHSIFLRMFFENIQPVTRHYGAPWGAY